MADVLLVSDDPSYAGPLVRALARQGLAVRRAALASLPGAPAEIALIDLPPRPFATAAARWLNARAGRYTAAVGDRLARDEIRALYARGLVRYLRRSTSPERVAACLAGDLPRAARLQALSRRAETEARRPAWRKALARAAEAVVPKGPERTARLAAFAGLSVAAGLLLGAGLQTAAESSTALERLEERIEALRADARDLRPGATPASPPWAAPDRGTPRPD